MHRLMLASNQEALARSKVSGPFLFCLKLILNVTAEVSRICVASLHLVLYVLLIQTIRLINNNNELLKQTLR